MKFKRNLVIFAGCAALVAAMSTALMGCPDDDDDDVFKSEVRMELPAQNVQA